MRLTGLVGCCCCWVLGYEVVLCWVVGGWVVVVVLVLLGDEVVLSLRLSG